ncbi:hypothetical protein [Streptomyces sp. DSM 41013]
MARRITNWAQHYKALARRQERALAEGQCRPAPGLTPPSQDDEWVHRAVAAQEARKEAADKARAERHAPPEEPTP